MAHIVSLFEQHSYLILFAGTFLELMALPISAEFLMSYSGYFVYLGEMNYMLAVLTAFVAALGGVTITYWIGRSGGYRLIEKYGKYIHLGPERYKKTADWFDQSGSKLLVFAYFVPGLRHFTGYVSGISRIPFRKFAIPAYSGAFLWGLCFITMGKVLGPRWEVFHEAARKYFVVFFIVFAVLLAAFLAYRIYKVQIKRFFIRFLIFLNRRMKTVRGIEVFLVILNLALIGLVVLMLGITQDYIDNEFTTFNKVTNYMAGHVFYKGWMEGFLIFQSPYFMGFFVLATLLVIWRKGRNRGLEYFLLFISLLGAMPFHASVAEAFSSMQSLGLAGNPHSPNFPDKNATIIVIFYGSCLFLLARHSNRNWPAAAATLAGIVLLLGVAAANIVKTEILPSDIVAGYIYGAVWIFFNFLLFEMLRIILGRSGRQEAEN